MNTDPTESIRRSMVAEINANASRLDETKDLAAQVSAERAKLEAQYGQVYDTKQLKNTLSRWDSWLLLSW